MIKNPPRCDLSLVDFYMQGQNIPVFNIPVVMKGLLYTGIYDASPHIPLMVYNVPVARTNIDYGQKFLHGDD